MADIKKCEHCGKDAVGSINDRPHCTKEECIKATIGNAMNPLAQALKAHFGITLGAHDEGT